MNDSTSTALVPINEPDPFDILVQMVANTVAPTSGRVYQQTYYAWRDWCKNHDHDPFHLTPATVTEFIASTPTTRETRRRQFSALRKLALVLAVADSGNHVKRGISDILNMTKPPHEGESSNERHTQALTPLQTAKVIAVWDQDNYLHHRNKAIISLLFFTGLRRSEAAALRWDDVDIERGILTIRHGKGDKSRVAAIAGNSALADLKVWRKDCPGRTWLFCRIIKNNFLGLDEPINAQTIYRVVKNTEALTGIIFSPHDARRTFITEALDMQTPLADVSDQVGHAQKSTTLRYAYAGDAVNRRPRLRLRYDG